MSPLAIPDRPDRLRGLLLQVHTLAERFPLSLLQLAFRISLAAVFWKSGLTKIASWDITLLLFYNEYPVPLLGPETAALLATAVELGGAVLIALGLLTRLAALPLLGLVFVIQVFVYTENWVEHLGWAAMLLFLVTRGGGALSLDRLQRPQLLGRGEH